MASLANQGVTIFFDLAAGRDFPRDGDKDPRLAAQGYWRIREPLSPAAELRAVAFHAPGMPPTQMAAAHYLAIASWAVSWAMTFPTVSSGLNVGLTSQLEGQKQNEIGNQPSCPQISSLVFSSATARGTAPNVLPANLAFWSYFVITGHGVFGVETSRTPPLGSAASPGLASSD